MRLLIGRTSYYVFAGGLAIMFLFPLVWTVVASVSPHAATAQQEGYGFGNYQLLVDYGAGLPRYLWNSSVVSAQTVVFTLVLSILGGYAFARFRFWGRDTLFLMVIAILMVPYVTLLVPLWVLFGEIGLRNNLLGLAIVNLRGGTSGANFGALEAGVVVMAIPCLVLFLLLQRYYIRGIMSGALN